MCGIFGYYSNADHRIPKGILAKMADSLRHRGPDNTGTFEDRGVGIGNNRLAIVDLRSGDQPITNEDGDLWIVYNGELYNHMEIREDLTPRGHRFTTLSDTETVLHAFEEYGEGCLAKFNGMFAFAIWNKRTKTLFLARDRMGIKPLYYALSGKTFFFGSELKAIIGPLPTSPEPNWGAIYRYLSFGYVPCPLSPFRGIMKLPPGHYAWVNSDGVSINEWWTHLYGSDRTTSCREARHNLIDLLDRAVELEMMSDVPVALFLSGGLDSSAVAYFASRGGKRALQSFSIRFEESTHDESEDARTMAEYLNLEHHEITFTHSMLTEYLFKVAAILDEPFGDSTVLPLLAVSEFARREAKVVLTGWGGDEIFAGYPTYRAHLIGGLVRGLLPGPLVNRGLVPLVNLLPVSDGYMSFEFKAKRFLKGMDLSPELQHFQWMGYLDEERKRALFRPEILEQVDEDTMAPVNIAVATLAESELISRILHLDALFFLEGNGLFQADRMTMAASLEARVPLLNNCLTEYVNPLPAKLKMPWGKPKELLRAAMKDLLPARIIRKPKKGFGPPSSTWTRGVLSETFDRIFACNDVTENGIFVPSEVERILQEHRARKVDHGRSLWALLSFQLWYNRFIKGEKLQV